MKPNPLVTQDKTFAEYVKLNFNKLLKKIQNKSIQERITFDEDVFMDTIVKCLTNVGKNKTNNSDIEKYFWKAYKRNVFTKSSREGFSNVVQINELTEDDDVIDEEYNEDIDLIIEIIEDKIKEEFGLEIYDAWKLHVCNNCTYTELKKLGYDITDLHNEFRQIKRHIQKWSKKDARLLTLMKENNFI